MLARALHGFVFYQQLDTRDEFCFLEDVEGRHCLLPGMYITQMYELIYMR